MAKIGYARVSSAGQDLTIQVEALKAAGCEVVRSEKVSGTTTKGRTELQTILDFLRSGDTLVCTRIDRLARSVLDLQNIVQAIRDRGAALLATEQPIIPARPLASAFSICSPSLPSSRQTYAAQRQLEGIAKAKAEGRYKGRPATIDAKEVAKLKRKGMSAIAISDQLGIARSTVYRLIGD